MAVEIIIPKMGETTTEVRILRWLKAVGDAVQKGEPLLEVETDKATIEIEAYTDGTLEEILVPEGEIADAMQVVATLSGESEAAAAPEGGRTPITAGERGTAVSSGTSPFVEINASPVARRMAKQLGLDLSEVRGSGRNAQVTADDVRHHHQRVAETPSRAPILHVSASPKARRLAKALGVDLSALAGSGMGGMITVADVEAAAGAAVPGGRVRELGKHRRAIATRMTASKQTVPHFYLMVDVLMTGAQGLREYCVARLGWERPPTYTDVIVRACALALASMPEVNVYYSDAGIVARNSVGIGVAVGLDEGLIVPVLPNADRIGLRETSEAIRDLIQRARDRRLRGSDVAERSMVVSNLGMEGVDAFVAIIDPPDPMILAVGRVTDRVVPFEGQVAIRPACTLSLSIDHRVLDGVMGSRFLMAVKGHLENPLQILGGWPR